MPDAFKSADYLFSDVKRFLKSYDTANLIDEGEFPTYVKDVLKRLGQSVLKECQFVAYVDKSIIDLPQDFETAIYAYKCKSTSTKRVGRVHEQSGSIMYNDITKDILFTDNNYDINCLSSSANVIERITIKHMVEDSDYLLNFSYPQLLHISTQENSFYQSNPNEIFISGNKLSVNFDDDWIYLKYYAFPLDEYGVPLIPNIESVYQAIKWYMIYQISLSWWWNTEVPDIQTKWQQAEQQYSKWMGEVSYENKLQTFADTIDSIRRKRKYSQQAFFTRNMYN